MRSCNAAVFLRKLLTIASVLAVTPAAVSAQPPAAGTGLSLRAAGWYGGLSAGRFEGDLGASLPPLSAAMPPTLAANQSSPGFKVFGGYQFSRHFALEGRLSDFGRPDAVRDNAAPVFGTTQGRTSGFRLDAVGIVPLQGGFSLFGKIGTLYSPGRSLNSGGNGLLPVPTFADPNPKSFEWNAKYGLGASYDVSSSTGLHFKYERASGYLGDVRSGEGNVGIWSFGLIKRY